MAGQLEPYVVQLGLGVFHAEATTLRLCSAQPFTYADAVANTIAVLGAGNAFAPPVLHHRDRHIAAPSGRAAHRANSATER